MANPQQGLRGWTENELRTLARDNFYQHDGQQIVLSGRPTADVMPFGLANVAAGFGGVAHAGVPPPQAPQAGAGADDLDDDFAPIRVGGRLAPGESITNPNARIIGPDEDIAGLGDFEDLTGLLDPIVPEIEQNAFGQGEFFDFDDPTGAPIYFEDPIQPVQPIQVQRGVGGRQINYANVRRMGNRSFGMRRADFFYEQIRRMRPEILGNLRNYMGYQLSATFSEKKTNQEYFQAVTVDFGTTQVDGETRRVPADLEVWDFDIHNRFAPMHLPSFSSVDGQFVRIDNAGDVDAALNLLIQSLKDAIPRESDSGREEGYAGTTKHLMNLFLFKFQRAAGGGPGRYDITEKPERHCLSAKSVFTPLRQETNLCFWKCLVCFLYKRYAHDGTGMGFQYDAMLTNMVRQGGAKMLREKLRKLCQLYAPKLQMLYANAKGLELNALAPMPMNMVDDVLEFYGCFKPVLIMDVDGKAIYGEIENAEKRRIENDEMTLLWIDDHYHLVFSYTGALVVKKCRRCDARFETHANLKRHLESKKCMTCVCRGSKDPFESEAEWRFHMETRENTCPHYRSVSKDDSLASTVDEKGKKLRFLNDPREDTYRKKKLAQEELERDHASFRNYEEAIFFDLESAVPMNKAGLKTEDHEYQVPYACGWISRSDALNGGEVKIAYGADCMEAFVDWMDLEYESLLKNEETLWFERASNGAMADPRPKKVRGFRNYAYRLKASWDKHLKNADSPGCLICGQMLDEGHGYTKEGENYTFSSCSRRVYARNTAETNMKTNFNNNAPRISVFAHNGGKYDWIFFHRYLMEKGKLDDLVTVRNSSKYFQLLYKGVFELKDSIYFMMGSLDKLGKDFNVETLKGIFPYRLMSCVEKANLVIEGEEEIRKQIPHEYFQISEKIKGPMGGIIKRDMNESEYVEFFEERGWRYDVEAETRMYLTDDVKCLFQVVEKFRQGWVEMPGSPRLFEYCTIGQMCHTYFLKNYLPVEMYPCLDVCEDAFIRKALYGGRTEVFRRVAPAGKSIHYVDVNSLYPYVMESCDLPCGDPVWHFRKEDPNLFEFAYSAFPVMTKVCDDEYFDDLMTGLNEQMGWEDIYGFVEVDVLCNLNCRYPVLPERRSMDGGTTFKNMFTNMEKKKMVYYTEELKRAIRKGYRVTHVHSYSKWQRGKVYQELIHVLKAQKLLGEGKDVNGERLPGVEKNPSLRAAAKVAQNSLFGKTIQFIDSSVQLVHTRERLFQSIHNAFTKVSIKPIFRSAVSDVVEVTSKFVVPKVQKRSCAAIGTAILAEARLVLYDYFDEVSRVGGEILYCDTDSIVFAGDVPLPERCMHDCHYGKMKVEIDPETIELGGFVGLSPKCYAFKLKNGDPYVRCKGVSLSQNLDMLPQERDAMDDLLAEMENEEYLESLGVQSDPNEVMTKGVNFEKMQDLILGRVDALVTKQLQFLKTTERHVSAYENVKLLRSRFDKRFLAEEGITYPWNDFNMNMEDILKTRNNVALSDYLDNTFPGEIEYVRKQYEDNEFFGIVFDAWLRSESMNVQEYKYFVECSGK